jgi:ornithine cyclodeaminase
MKEARIFVDQRAACLKEAGDLIILINSGILCEKDIAGEIGEVVGGNVAGRVTADDITVFKSVGIAVQDLYVANAIYERVSSEGKSVS